MLYTLRRTESTQHVFDYSSSGVWNIQFRGPDFNAEYL